eukprot:CAMPEP_0196690428 /NCGR_PEP_ID=MMETSP1090-20130531/19889_1 /TAXON_ID=37098 /ORGANISM="Isochrysis sp, Strain CCMP1244" /LENGTH=290 /DNA_ID=CAMNT_0042029527 /DNA_START=97 /DNA_END=970 /DNA_ORIENTATION=-
MHGRVFGATSSLLAFVKEGHELPDSLQQAVALRRPPRTRLRERQRPADRVGGAEDAAEAAGVAERSLHHVADGVLDGESTVVKLERASLRRSAERFAGRLAAEEAAAAVGAAGLAREPDSARVEGVGPEVVEARVQVGEGGLEVEAADCLQVLVAREPVRASNVRPHEDKLGREKLWLLGALAVEEKAFAAEMSSASLSGKSRARSAAASSRNIESEAAGASRARFFPRRPAPRWKPAVPPMAGHTCEPVGMTFPSNDDDRSRTPESYQELSGAALSAEHTEGDNRNSAI